MIDFTSFLTIYEGYGRSVRSDKLYVRGIDFAQNIRKACNILDNFIGKACGFGTKIIGKACILLQISKKSSIFVAILH